MKQDFPKVIRYAIIATALWGVFTTFIGIEIFLDGSWFAIVFTIVINSLLASLFLWKSNTDEFLKNVLYLGWIIAQIADLIVTMDANQKFLASENAPEAMVVLFSIMFTVIIAVSKITTARFLVIGDEKSVSLSDEVITKEA